MTTPEHRGYGPEDFQPDKRCETCGHSWRKHRNLDGCCSVQRCTCGRAAMTRIADATRGGTQCSFCGFPNSCSCKRAGQGGCELSGEGEDTMCACCAIDDDAPQCCRAGER